MKFNTIYGLLEREIACTVHDITTKEVEHWSDEFLQGFFNQFMYVTQDIITKEFV